MASLSVLDLVMIGEGKIFSDSLSEALTLARHIEKYGLKRFWVAEHHSIPGIASAATTLIMSHIAAGTRTLRIGSGGIMMPNHSPLIVAEQFATLAALYPDRIDLGVSRAEMRFPRRLIDWDGVMSGMLPKALNSKRAVNTKRR